jgi:hypothetical protein
MTQQQERVNKLIERIERHQQAMKLSDVRFVARYQRFLSSDKTWRHRLCARAWDEFGQRLDKWESKLNAMVAELDGGADISAFFGTLPIARYGQAVYDMLQGQQNDRRVAWLIGPTGVGKSWTMLHVAQEGKAAAAYLHINRGMRESLMALSSALATRVGATITGSASRTFQNVVDCLRENPITLCIDDVHEGGVVMLKLIKHLVDDTRSRFILGTYPTAWRMLLNGSTDANVEAQQLIGRSIKPVRRTWEGGLTEADIAAYLGNVIGDVGECRILAGRIRDTICRNGNLRLLADAVDTARMNADEDGVDITAELVELAVADMCPTPEKK